MNPIDSDDLTLAHKHSFKNRSEVLASEVCGCFCCLNIYPPSRISEWVTERDGEGTALCPMCGIDSVIGSASGYSVTAERLERMEKRWFALKSD